MQEYAIEVQAVRESPSVPFGPFMLARCLDTRVLAGLCQHMTTTINWHYTEQACVRAQGTTAGSWCWPSTALL